ISENCSLIFGEFRLISEGVGSVPAVYQVLSLGQKSKVIFVPGSCPTFFPNLLFSTTKHLLISL
ncbi:hypothetical protein, partial [Enterococcus faecalis]